MADDRPPSPDRRRLLIALGYGTLNVAALGRLLGGRRRHDRWPRRPATASRAIRARGFASAVTHAKPAPPDDHVYDIVINGGRVIDPDTRYDRVADVGIDGTTIAAIKTQRLKGRKTIDATDKVVSAGFIDLLSYEPTTTAPGSRSATASRPTSACTASTPRPSTSSRRYEGRCVVHFGGAFDNPWIRANLFGINPGQAASPAQIGQLADECDRQIHDGWIGVDFEPEYTPGITFDEMKALAEVAKRNDVPVLLPRPLLGGRDQHADAPRDHRGGQADRRPVHVEHIISTGGTFDMAKSLEHLQQARDQGYDVSACMYPYDFWATYLGSPRFNPGWQERFRITTPTCRSPAPANGSPRRRSRSTSGRTSSPRRSPSPRRTSDTCLSDPHVMIGSDAILTNGNNHPRATGCFSRTLGSTRGTTR